MIEGTDNGSGQAAVAGSSAAAAPSPAGAQGAPVAIVTPTEPGSFGNGSVDDVMRGFSDLGNGNNPYLKQLSQLKPDEPSAQQAVPDAKVTDAAATAPIVAVEDPNKAAKPAEEKPAAEEGAEIDSPLFGGKKNIGKAPAATTPEAGIESEADLVASVKSAFGQDIAGIKDMGKVFETAKKWRQDSQKIPDLEKKIGAYDQIFTQMPEALLDAVKAHLKAEDWRTPIINQPSFDFNKTVDQQDSKQLINHYFPGEFNDQDFAEDADPQVKKAVEIAKKSAKDRYQTDKTTIDTRRASAIETANQRNKLFKDSIQGSVSHVKEVFPDLADDTLEEISRTLEGGTSAIIGEFFNQDGTLKKDAAEKLALAKHGKGVIDQLTKFAANRAATKATEEVLMRSSEKPGDAKGGGASDTAVISPETTQFIQSFMHGLDKKPTY